MLHNEYAGQDCSAARALEAVGERWTLLIVRDLLRGPARFGELERRLGVSKNVLTNRLEKLVALGIAERVPYDPARDWARYELTSKGRDLFPVVHALIAWGDAHLAPDGPPVTLEHACGHPAGHRVVCGACGDEVSAGTVRAVARRGFSPSPSR